MKTGSKVGWKDVPGFEGLHKAGSDGSVKNLKTGRISSKGNGIRLINKRGEEVKTTKPRVVLTAFRGPPPSDQHYAVRIDRSGGWELKNLAWKRRSEHPPRCKLDKRTVSEIRKLARKGLSNSEIAERYGLTRGSVWAIANNRCWL